MNRRALALIGTVTSFFGVAIEANAAKIPIQCVADYHVLALYQDGSGNSIERSQNPLTLAFETNRPHQVQWTVESKTFSVGAACVQTGAKPDGSPTGYPAIYLQITDEATHSVVDTVVPLKTQAGQI
jgi:hypothetical protein